jgi:PPM family protein phosphatase
MRTAVVSAAGSDAGIIRSGNEDSAYNGRWLFAVADGMGGHAAGEVASAIAIETIARYDSLTPQGHLVAVLGEAVREANQAIRVRAESDPETYGMGTTLTAMLWSEETFALAHIGDSRAYRLRSGQFRQLTEDHSLGNLVSKAPSALAPIISRYLDGRPDRSPDLAIREALAGDRYLLCSDGLTAVVPDTAIHEAVSSDASPEQTVSQLIKLANSSGGPDNVTVILIDVDTQPGASVSPPSMLGAAYLPVKVRGLKPQSEAFHTKPSGCPRQIPL